jgi:hypothetical protein
MPDEETIERAREDAAEGKSPSTQAGEFVREEIEPVGPGKFSTDAKTLSNLKRFGCSAWCSCFRETYPCIKRRWRP